mgnify:FL=1
MDNQMLRKASRMLKTMADPTRLRILLVLGEGEISVKGLCEQLGMEQSAISHQLSVLRRERLVTSRRQGRNSLYAPCDHHIYTLIDQVREHVEEL